MRVLLITPPTIEPTAAYPATAYLTGFLRSRGIECVQEDLGLKLTLRLYSKDGLIQIRNELLRKWTGKSNTPLSVRFFLDSFSEYHLKIEQTISFLQGKDLNVAHRIVKPDYFPKSPRAMNQWAFEQSAVSGVLRQMLGQKEFRKLQEKEDFTIKDPLAFWFGRIGIYDRARYLASQFLEDISHLIKDGIDPSYDLRGFGEAIASSARTFAPMQRELENDPTLIGKIVDELAQEAIARHKPTVLGITIPFAAAAFGAFRIARAAKALDKDLPIALGGGFVNCCMRKLSDAKVFRYVDYVCLDDGEKPFLCLIEHLQGKRTTKELLRTFALEDGKVLMHSNSREHDIPHRDLGSPCYDGIDTNSYLSIQTNLCPFERMEKNGHWNKLTLAHGCYWKKCAFCDVNIDYIGRYDTAPAERLVKRIEEVIEQTNCRSFHFVDEAAPPATLRALSNLLIERNIQISWHCMVRWDKAFTPELAALMARAGCVGVAGGVEVPSNRVLKLINKGTSIEQIARVTKIFRSQGVLVMGFLMFAFPTETQQELIDSLEFVRQLFKEGCLTSGSWNKFTVTPGAPVAANPEKYGIKLIDQGRVTFAEYIIPYEDKRLQMYDRLWPGLLRAIGHYRHACGVDWDVRQWFEGQRVPKPTLAPDFVRRILDSEPAREEPKQALLTKRKATTRAFLSGAP